MLRSILLLLPAAALSIALACGGGKDATPPLPAYPPFAEVRGPVPDGVAECTGCHAQIVRDWLSNGMSDTLGPLPAALADQVLGDAVDSERGGFHYRIAAVESGLRIEQRRARDGSATHERSQELIWRIGAGVAAYSLIARENGRWYFAPLEFFRDHGWVLAPAEQRPQPAGLGRPITSECLSCHTTEALPEVYPLHDLQDLRPTGLDCSACHGDPDAHLRKMRLPTDQVPYDGDPEILDPAALPVPRQLDICARCHLQGDARIELAPDGSPPFRPGDDLFARRAVFVAANPDDDFGFVSQVERLALSACFQQSPSMSCTTCHDPHQPSRLMERQKLVAACTACHPGDPHPQPVRDRGRDCIDCHMRRSQPFDLGHVEIHDHWIRREPPPAQHDLPIRELETTDGQLAEFRYRESDAGRRTPRESAALHAMALTHLGEAPHALARFGELPPPGDPAAVLPSPQEGPWPVLALPMLHFLRGRALAENGDAVQAMQAYRDALRLDPSLPEAQVNLAWLLARQGRLDAVPPIAEKLAREHPRSATPWNLLAFVAAERNHTDAAVQAFRRSLEREPQQAAVWRALGQAHLLRGEGDEARRCFTRAAALDPDLPLPGTH